MSATPGCSGKEAFTDPALAKKVAKRMCDRGKIVVVYRCWHCGMRHVGTPLGMKPGHRKNKWGRS